MDSLWLNRQLLTEDNFVNCLNNMDSMLMTRKVSNFDKNALSKYENCRVVGLTGYDNIVAYFFNNIIDKFKHKIVLVTLETDGFNMRQEYINHPKLFHWFTWNKSVAHDKITCIPIGLNADRHEKSLREFFESKNNVKRDKLFAVNLNVSSNPARQGLVDLAQSRWVSFCTFIKNIPFKQTYWRHSHIENQIKIEVTSPECYKLISEFKFILSPPGAGVDCHRTWEALYLGTIPIIIKSPINEMFHDLPVLIVDNWSVITKEFLETKYSEIQSKIQNKEYNMGKLYFDYWKNMIERKM